MAKGATKSNAAEVSRLVHEAVLRLAESDTGPMKLQAKKGDTDGAFPAGTSAAIKEAIEKLKAADAPLVRVTGKDGKTELVELAPAGVAAVGAAVAFAAESLPAVEGIRLAERVMTKRPETVVELEPLITRLTEQRKQEDEREAKQRQADADRRRQVREAMARWEAGTVARTQARIAELQRELAALGGSTTSTPAKATATPYPKDAKEFVRQEARRLVSAWADAVRLNKAEARLALEVVLGNLSAMEQIGEEGDEVAFNPVHHECDTPASKGVGVTILQPGWRLLEDGGAEYVVAKAKVR